MGKGAPEAVLVDKNMSAGARFKKWWERAWPPLTVIVVITFVYAVFVVYNLLPQFLKANGVSLPNKPDNPDDYTPSKSEILGMIISFHALFLLLLTAFARSAYTPAGSIPNNDFWKYGHELKKLGENAKALLRKVLIMRGADGKFFYTGTVLEQFQQFLKSLPVIERKLKLKKNPVELQLRYCSTCKLFKPDRTHHCSICNHCILRMDHHCPWVSNCIGFHNYKYFMQFLFFGWVSCAFILVGMARRLLRTFRPVIDPWYFVGVDLPIIIAYLFSAFLFVALFLFFLFHMNLIINCLTTIEFREKRNSSKEVIQHRWEVAHQKFDRGSGYRNVLHIFGSPWMWLLPIESNHLDTEGTYVETLPFPEEEIASILAGNAPRAITSDATQQQGLLSSSQGDSSSIPDTDAKLNAAADAIAAAV
jgi:DHHC palmitoyltransferase